MSPDPSFSQEILLVEDDALARAALTRILKGRGYQVAEASNSSEALLEATEGGLSVVVMDIRLGADLDGIDAAEEIQKLQPLTSFIFISAYMEAEHRKRARKKGVRVGGWIEKPIQVTELVELIERERKKLAVLFAIETAKKTGMNPVDCLRGLEDSISPDLASEIRSELEEPEKTASTAAPERRVVE